MSTSRGSDAASLARRRTAAAADAEERVSAAHLLLRTWPGRLFLISAALKVVVGALRLMGAFPLVVNSLSALATIGIVATLGFFVWRLFMLTKRRLLWAVRRKLILSYIFIGVVPSLLIVIFFLLGGMLIFMSVSAYLFKDGYDAALNYVKVTTDGAAAEIARAPEAAAQSLARTHRNGSKLYRAISFEYLPGPGSPRELSQRLQAGAWEHMTPPPSVPAWITREGWSGTVEQSSPDERARVELVNRAVAAVVVDGKLAGYVVGDLPINEDMVQTLREKTGVRAGSAALIGTPKDGQSTALTTDPNAAQESGWSTLFRKSVIFLDCVDWASGHPGRVSIALTYRPTDLYRRLSEAQQIAFRNVPLGVVFIIGLLIIAGLFLIIESVALSMGLALARSITSSIHELFTGTERVRFGDFSHRIDVHTNDQLGELAGSFNEMNGSIEGLLQTAAEKKRLEEELRIAHEIQMSLLPRGPLDVPGLGITALCVPAREVGGDYYDFFRLTGNRMGILIADVSGKGTSAALYMAELKGLVLALSQRYDSPRELLIEVNRIISEHLDSRSFITAAYAVVDLERGVMRFCRAGHTPLIFFSGNSVPAARVLTPNGMVLGLRIEGAEDLFEQLLEEVRIDLTPGDVIVLYTDGITEAMNVDSELFGEGRLSRLIEEHGHLESGELRERIMREVESFVGAANQHDDMTMILVKVEPAFIAAGRVAV
jgi:sigma-B regulation protein RsbU (phosphoserine phosphatase)